MATFPRTLDQQQSTSAWTRIHVGTCHSYTDAEVDHLMQVAGAGNVDASAFPSLTILEPGDAFATPVGGQPMLKVACLDEEHIGRLLGGQGRDLLH
jgi:hypothetical protein